MSGWYLWLKWLHVISATVLLGTGTGISFFAVRAHRTRNIQVIASMMGDVRVANAMFMATAVVLAPLTGFAMVRTAHFPVVLLWLRSSVFLYAVVGACWLPLPWLQVRLHYLARRAAAEASGLPPQYLQRYLWWQALGWLGSAALLAIFCLMIVKPF
jgi:uncharacterized membrane protein